MNLLRREIEQEKLATSNLAAKVIQTEKVVELKSSLERRHQEKIKRMEDEIQCQSKSEDQGAGGDHSRRSEEDRGVEWEGDFVGEGVYVLVRRGGYVCR